jgi:hypothetical protein
MFFKGAERTEPIFIIYMVTLEQIMQSKEKWIWRHFNKTKSYLQKQYIHEHGVEW